MYSLIPTAVRGRSSSTAERYALGRGIQHAEAVPARPRAGAPILASLDDDASCGGATNHMEGQFATGITLSCATPVGNTPYAFKVPDACGALPHLVVDRGRRTARDGRACRWSGSE